MSAILVQVKNRNEPSIMTLGKVYDIFTTTGSMIYVQMELGVESKDDTKIREVKRRSPTHKRHPGPYVIGIRMIGLRDEFYPILRDPLVRKELEYLRRLIPIKVVTKAEIIQNKLRTLTYIDHSVPKAPKEKPKVASSQNSDDHMLDFQHVGAEEEVINEGEEDVVKEEHVSDDSEDGMDYDESDRGYEDQSETVRTTIEFDGDHQMADT